MSNKLSIVIMAHPQRQEIARVLSQQLQAPTVYDRKNNVWDTCRRAWLSQVSVGAEYTLVLQDDAIVCKDFRARAEAILNKQDKYYLTAFYVGGLAKYRVRSILAQGKDHFVSSVIFNEVALCLPTKYIEDMVLYSDNREAVNDHLIGQWAHMRRLKVYYPIPSLVDHRIDVPSIYRTNLNKPNPDQPRQATAFIDDPLYEKS